MSSEAGFLVACRCGILYKLTSIDMTHECANCGANVTVKIDHVLRTPKDGVLRGFLAER